VLGLVSTNPPGAVGAIYCALDALVAVASRTLTAWKFSRTSWSAS